VDTGLGFAPLRILWRAAAVCNSFVEDGHVRPEPSKDDGPRLSGMSRLDIVESACAIGMMCRPDITTGRISYRTRHDLTLS
jgi:hypothetical protein